ncbi:MAG TPA: recombinase family protein [Bacillota bacterium]|nr:recombinase family protein [Bacillota bacterium]
MQESRSVKAAIYNRIGTFYEEFALEDRRVELEKYSRDALGIDDLEVFDEVGIFDREVDRPAYRELMRRIRQQEFTHLVVWDWDSLFHDCDDLNRLLQELNDHGIILVGKAEE